MIQANQNMSTDLIAEATKISMDQGANNVTK